MNWIDDISGTERKKQMKYVALGLVLCISSFVHGQIDSLGLDDSPWLNRAETDLLNEMLSERLEGYDFSNKKIGFVTNSTGSNPLPKSEFFNRGFKSYLEQGTTPQVFAVILSESEKQESGGYDVFVLSWVKLFTDRRKRKTIEYFSRQTGKEKSY